jgi:hypothetical protein
MKKTILTLSFVTMALLLPVYASHVLAQLEVSLQAKIPFSFNVCREQLAAGTYIIKHPTGSTSTLMVKSEDNKSIDLACVNDIQSDKPVKEGRLVFNRYGDQYFLAETWWPGDTVGHAIVKSEKEQALIKELGLDPKKGAKKPEKVIIKVVKPGKS